MITTNAGGAALGDWLTETIFLTCFCVGHLVRIFLLPWVEEPPSSGKHPSKRRGKANGSCPSSWMLKTKSPVTPASVTPRRPACPARALHVSAASTAQRVRGQGGSPGVGDSSVCCVSAFWSRRCCATFCNAICIIYSHPSCGL